MSAVVCEARGRRKSGGFLKEAEIKKVSAAAMSLLNAVKQDSIWVGDHHEIVDDLFLLYQICCDQPNNLHLILESPLPSKYKSRFSKNLQTELLGYQQSKNKRKFSEKSMLARCLMPSRERKLLLGGCKKEAKSDITKLSDISAEIANLVYSGGGQAHLIGGRPNIGGGDLEESQSDKKISTNLPIVHSDYASDLNFLRKKLGKNNVIFSGLSHVISYPGHPPGIIHADGRQYEVPSSAYGQFRAKDVGIAFEEVVASYVKELIDKAYFQTIENLNDTFRFFHLEEDKFDSDTAPSIVFVLRENKAAVKKISDLKAAEVYFSQNNKAPIVNKSSDCIIL